MIGASGIGKSDFWAQDPKAFFIEAEAGLNFVEVFKLPARSWDDLREIYASLKEKQAEGGEFPYSMVVIDTIDKVVEYAEEEVVSRAKAFYSKMADQINSIGDIPNGGGWSKTKSLVMNFLSKMEGLPCALVFIGHLSTKRIEKGSNKYDKDTISLWKGVGEAILAFPDHLMHLEARMAGDRLQRIVWTKPTQTREAKSRGGTIPDGAKWGSDSKANYEEFRKIFK